VKKIIFSLLAVALCVGMIGSAFAYFTDVETSTGNTFQAGTLDMQIKDVDQGYRDGSVSASYCSPAGLAPGQTFTTDWVYLKNVGSMDINRIWARFCVLNEVNGTSGEFEGGASDIQNYFKLVSYTEWSSNPAWYGASDEDPNPDGSYTESFPQANADAYLNYWANIRGGGALFDADKGYITLADLVNASSYGSGDKVTSLLLFDSTPETFIPPLLHNNGTVQIKFTFELMPEVTNAYQGDSVNFEVDFIGSQLTDYPDDQLYDYITEPLGTPPALNLVP